MAVNNQNRAPVGDQPAKASKTGSIIGLLGGSFDPIHHAHLSLAQAALNTLQLTQLRFIPTGQAWQKSGSTAAVHRAKMVSLAIQNEARFVLDTTEIDRAGPSYTVDTLRTLRQHYGGAQALVFVMGADQFARLTTWHQWQQLIELAHLAVARRNGEPLVLSAAMQTFYQQHAAAAATLKTQAAGLIAEVPMPASPLSSTEIRAQIKQGELSSVRQAVPASVLDYIASHSLYF